LARKKEDKTLELEARKKIYDFVVASPGTHLREIQRQIELPLGTVEYHLKYLVDKEMLVEKTDGNYKRYYPVGLYGSVDKKLLSLLRQEVPRRVVMKLLLNPGINFKILSEGFPVSASTLSYHLSKLVDGEIVRKVKKGRESHYYVNNQEDVAKVILTHRKSFLDGLVESFANLWEEFKL
jgi:predicted transcriptional regulator